MSFDEIPGGDEDGHPMVIRTTSSPAATPTFVTRDTRCIMMASSPNASSNVIKTSERFLFDFRAVKMTLGIPPLADPRVPPY